MQTSSKLALGLLLSLIWTSVIAKSAHKRVELMKYAIRLESAVLHETKWEVSWLEKFKLIEEAYAYKEGETCLVLGFKSQYKNGKCRLSSAEDIKDYKAQCSGSTLPCNPQIFGKPSADKPFCITPSGNELSKACAKETFSFVAKQSKAPELKNIPKMSLKNFDLEQIDLSNMSPELSTAFDAVFKHEDSSLETATKFAEGLCEDLKMSTATGHQPLDNQVCEQHLALLKQGNVTPTVTKQEEPQEQPEQQPEEETPPLNLTSEEECVDPILEPQKENIQDVADVTHQSDVTALMNCVVKIQEHKIIVDHEAGSLESQKERGRFFDYWHELNGEKQFGRLCINSSTNDKAVFAFISPAGLSMVNVPVSNIKESVSRVSFKGKEYYIVRDMLGDYFEFIDKTKLSSAPKGTQEDIATYNRKGGGKVDNIFAVPDGQREEMKVCIRERLEEYLDWITYPRGILPSTSEYNADVKVYNAGLSSGKPGESLKPKYAKTVDEIKKELYAKAMTEVPDCRGILSEENFNKQFDKDHADSIRLYNQFRSILKLD